MYICAVNVHATCLLHWYIGTAWVQHVMYIHVHESVPSHCGYGIIRVYEMIRVYIRVHMYNHVCVCAHLCDF